MNLTTSFSLIMTVKSSIKTSSNCTIKSNKTSSHITNDILNILDITDSLYTNDTLDTIDIYYARGKLIPIAITILVILI